jgi:hypothetical protein
MRTETPTCTEGWTKWLSHDNQKSGRGTDVELLPTVDQLVSCSSNRSVIMYGELERTWEEVVVAYLKALYHCSHEGAGKAEIPWPGYMVLHQRLELDTSEILELTYWTE